MFRIVTTVFVMLVALSASASAEECVPSTSAPELTVPQPNDGTWYLDNDVCQPGCFFSVWSYMEANGIEGLQRYDDAVDDTCAGLIEPDTAGAPFVPS